jgi:hypothetical protein
MFKKLPFKYYCPPKLLVVPSLRGPQAPIVYKKLPTIAKVLNILHFAAVIITFVLGWCLFIMTKDAIVAVCGLFLISITCSHFADLYKKKVPLIGTLCFQR